MKKILLLLFVLAYHFSSAHPPVGIVRDSKGNIYYSDLVHVWKLSPGGKRSIAVHHVHTHELYLDANDNLYGEHLWYNGESLDTWGHYVWRLSSNNKLDTVIKPSAGFLKNYSFVRDGKENMYWVERDTVSTFKKRSPDGSITTILKGKFTDVRWMHVTKAGVLYFVDLYDLYKVVAGKLILVAKNISHNTVAFGWLGGGKHSLMGIWTDKYENVYVANLSGQAVKRVTQTGKVENFIHSTTPWSPTGGLFDNDGSLWLLETSVKNEIRVRKIVPTAFNKGQTTGIIIRNYILPGSIGLAIALAVFLLIRLLFGMRRRTTLLA